MSKLFSREPRASVDYTLALGSRLNGASPHSGSGNRLERLDGLVVIRVLRDFWDVFAVGDLAGLVDDEQGPRQEGNRQPLDQAAVILTEGLVVQVGKSLHVGNVFRRAKPLLGKGHVQAD